MPKVHVRNLPADLHQRLREQAAAEGRSVSAEEIVLLRRALDPAGRQGAAQRAAMTWLQEIRLRNELRPGAPTAEQLVRADRDSAG